MSEPYQTSTQSKFEDKMRTIKQNKALHLYCGQLAEKLNEAGINQKLLMQGFEIDNSAESIKNIFREIGRVKYLKDSTAKFTTKEMMDVFDEVNRVVSLKGISLNWPTDEELYYSQVK